MVNISDIQDNSNFNIAVETTGAIHTSNDFLNLPENNSLTLTTGNSHLINLQKKVKGKDATTKNGPLQSSTPMKKKSTDIVALEV